MINVLFQGTAHTGIELYFIDFYLGYPSPAICLPSTLSFSNFLFTLSSRLVSISTLFSEINYLERFQTQRPPKNNIKYIWQPSAPYFSIARHFFLLLESCLSFKAVVQGLTLISLTCPQKNKKPRAPSCSARMCAQAFRTSKCLYTGFRTFAHLGAARPSAGEIVCTCYKWNVLRIPKQKACRGTISKKHCGSSNKLPAQAPNKEEEEKHKLSMVDTISFYSRSEIRS